MERPLGIDPGSGRPVSVRFGRFGAFAQIGTREDEEKPKFASLRPHQRMDEITLADAIELFKLPRTLGEWEDGHSIKVAVGRFGPYVQYGTKKYASLKNEDDPYTITRERALQLIREKQEIEANRIIRDFGVDDIQVLNGRYGPYVSDRKKNGKIPKDRDPKTLTLEECRAILAAAPERRGGWGRRGSAKTAAKTEPAADAAVTPPQDAGAAPADRKLAARRAKVVPTVKAPPASTKPPAAAAPQKAAAMKSAAKKAVAKKKVAKKAPSRGR
jgi:DNA topoisomerase-1